MSNDASIGIFDSGFGGLTVMRAIRQVLPHENIIYFGDTARVPYGSKSPETIFRYTLENSAFLVDQGIKVLVIACHTACSIAFNEIKKMSKVPIIGVLLPAVEEVVKQTKKGSVAILGTRATISSGVYQEEISKRLPQAEIMSISCPLLVPLVEEGYIEHPVSELIIQEYLRPLRHKPIDTLLLACTHYPLLFTTIQKILGEEVTLIDPAASCADYVKDLLTKKNLLNPQNDTPNYQFYVSDDPEKFRLLGKTFLNYPIEYIISKPV